MLCLAVAGCSGVGDESDEMGDESAALTGGSYAEGTKVVTTTRLRFREGPSTSAAVIRVLGSQTTLRIVSGTPENGFYAVALADGTEGYCHGGYLTVARAGTSADSAAGDSTDGPATPSGESFRTKGTGYYPANNAMEGGFVDRRGAELRTLQQYLAGNVEYVSVAMDSNAFEYGTKLRIRELEQKYGRKIEFRVVDTGGAFRGRGRSRMDICTQNRSSSLDPVINGMLTASVGLE